MEINDYPNYLIYDDGRVYSKKRKTFLKPQELKQGYKYNMLYKNGKQKNISIHRLVALHYIPNPNNKPQVDHIDRNTQNNDVSNLRWVTREEQMNNRSITTNTGEKYITKLFRKHRNSFSYYIKKNDCFHRYLTCNKHTLQDAINLRDAILG